MVRNVRIEKALSEIIDEYCIHNSNKPWIIGFSGGKDSTVLLTLVWRALDEIKKLKPPFQLKRPIYVVCNDTLVENPVILDYVHLTLEKIECFSRDSRYPIFVRKTVPMLEESFWVNIIGKGYPAPNNTFRWCTDKLKIKPTSKFITEQVSEYDEAIILLGTRLSESHTRARSIKKHEVTDKRLSRHPNHANTYVFTPIKHLLLGDIWSILQENNGKSPWGGDNSRLYQIYVDANADDYECPTLITNKSHKSCGQSRFGCWTCTLVKEDKSMSSLIETGESWMKPLLLYRNDLISERNKSENRSRFRRNGQEATNNLGTYSDIYRASLLNRLLRTQKEVQKTKPHIELISNQELIAIQVIWYRDGLFEYKVSDIYRDVYDKELEVIRNSHQYREEKQLLEQACETNPADFNLISDLLVLQNNKTILMNKYGLINDLENRIEQYLKDLSNEDIKNYN